MEEKYSLLLTVLKELRNAGVLNELVLAGSWCQYFYRILFDKAPEIPLIRTTDIGFLVSNPNSCDWARKRQAVRNQAIQH
jgi:hypothetical protein